MKHFAVIDLGTNTFHLLIVKHNAAGSFEELHRERRFIKLAENGIEKIGPAPFQRGLQALLDYKKILDKFQVTTFKALGTAALRRASNGKDFIQEVKAQTDISIQLISGEEEAELIHKGVSQAVPFGQAKNLIMDIGGGSVEFIICDKDQIFWKQSFPIGVAVLFNKFHTSDPIHVSEVLAVEQHLQKILTPLLQELEKHQVQSLVGASGTFDVLENILVEKKASPVHSYLSDQKFNPLFQIILKSTLAERYAMEGLPETRADLIVVASILIDFILKQTAIKEIIISAYAMKEGQLAKMMF